MEWLPYINLHIPMSGITAWNVWDLPFEFWVTYRDMAKAIVDLRNKEARK